jgi:RNA polymerase sigma factor (TIGR02999 family)
MDRIVDQKTIEFPTDLAYTERVAPRPPSVRDPRSDNGRWSMSEPGEVTQLLESAGAGEPHAMDQLFSVVYAELQRIAHRQLGMERPGHTLETSGLVHEAYLKLVGLERMEWRGRSHFFAAAAGAMRRILIDHAASRQTLKRGGGRQQVPLSEADRPATAALDDRSLEELLALDQALERLRALDERQARVVECRFFAGMTIDEVAEALDVSPMTVKRDWAAARARLNRELAE